MYLNEAEYFSNINELNIIDANFQNIINEVSVQTIYNYKSFREYSNNIAELVKKLFNFEDVIINWSYVAPNAFTIPLSLVITNTMDNDLVKTNKGFKFKNSKGKISFFGLDIGLITILGLDNKEMTAFLLHEIGHNFYLNTVNQVFKLIMNIIIVIIDIMNNVDKPFELLSEIFQLVIFSTKSGRNQVYRFTKWDANHNDDNFNTFFLKFGSLSTYVKSLVMSLLNLFLLPLSAVIATGKVVFTTPINLVTNALLGYKDEKFADNFATMYGYGPYLTSGLEKLTHANNKSLEGKIYSKPISKAGRIVNIYYGTLIHYITALMSLGDSHPTAPTRIKEQKRYLEECLKGRLPEKDKKLIMKQIDEIDAVYDRLFKNTTTNLEADTLRNAFYSLRRALGISDEDWKELLFKTKNYDYDHILSTR